MKKKEYLIPQTVITSLETSRLMALAIPSDKGSVAGAMPRRTQVF